MAQGPETSETLAEFRSAAAGAKFRTLARAKGVDIPWAKDGPRMRTRNGRGSIPLEILPSGYLMIVNDG